MPRRTSILALALASTVACGATSPRSAAPSPTPSSGEVVATFADAEDRALRDLAALDARIAARARMTPREDDRRRVAVTALLSEDPSIAIVDGAVDPFSFEVRARGLEAIAKELARAPRDLPVEAAGTIPAPRLERELLERLVASESVRVDEERRLPRSASALVRGIVATWAPPRSPDETDERATWLARRLGEIRESLAGGAAPALDVVRARELDDALDGLERAIDAPGFSKATAALLKLREALEAIGANGARPSTTAASPWKEVARGLAAHAGVRQPPEALDAALATAEREARARATAALGGHDVDEELAARVAETVLASSAGARGARGQCVDAIPGSRVRSMAPPPERLAACQLRHALASDAGSTSAALVALHEHVVVAAWALDLARGRGSLAQIEARHPPMSQPAPDVLARWERAALARPVVAIGAGMSAALLLRGDVGARARAWRALGDVPLDVAERELAPAPADPRAAR